MCLTRSTCGRFIQLEYLCKEIERWPLQISSASRKKQNYQVNGGGWFVLWVRTSRVWNTSRTFQNSDLQNLQHENYAPLAHRPRNSLRMVLRQDIMFQAFKTKLNVALYKQFILNNRCNSVYVLVAWAILYSAQQHINKQKLKKGTYSWIMYECKIFKILTFVKA